MSINVTLNVSDSAQTGYTATPASNGSTYYYKYTGGSDGNGNVTEKVGSPQDIVVLMDTTGYKINDVSFANDPNDQLTWSRDSDTQITIADADTVVESNAYYKIVAANAAGTITFDCDPRITNDP